MKAHGKCLCGSVTLEVEYASNELAACHCRMCRNWSGGPMLALDCNLLMKSQNIISSKIKRRIWPAKKFLPTIHKVTDCDEVGLCNVRV